MPIDHTEEILRQIETRNYKSMQAENTDMERVNTSDVQSGDVVAGERSAFYNAPNSDAVIDNGKYFAELTTTNPDSDNDLSCRVLDEQGDPVQETYINADSMYSPDVLPWDTVEPDREIEHKVEQDVGDEAHLDVLQEEQENLVQMQEIQSRTVADGVLQLDVDRVTSASNSEQWAIIVNHPVLGELTFYEEKPVTGWTDDYRIVDLLKSYNIFDGNPYKLQQKEVFVEFTGSNPDLAEHWDLCFRDEIIDEYGYPSSGMGESSSSKSQSSSGGEPALIQAMNKIFGLPGE